MTPALKEYDYIILATSGGKDSQACFFHLMDLGVPPQKIELWHHLIDGEDDFMDWPCTRSYCNNFAQAFNAPIFFSWKQQGFRGELLRKREKTKPTTFEMPDDYGNIIECSVGGRGGKKATRLKFPQVAADLRVRWCTAYLKIDPADKALANQRRFRNKKILFITGERAEESPNRAKYAEFEPHRADLRNGKRFIRHIDHWRPVHQWTEEKIWAIIEKNKVVPHPAYRLGWGRLSCITCIFGSSNQWASIFKIDSERIKMLAGYEKEFGYTIHRTMDIWKRISEGVSYEGMSPELIGMGLSKKYTGKIFTDKWELPKGAFGESAGPS